MSTVQQHDLLNVSANDLKAAIAMAGAEWNENSNGVYFQYDGTTTRSFLPTYEESRYVSGVWTWGCDELGIDYSLVRVLDDCSPGSGPPYMIVIPKCLEMPSMEPTQFDIYIYVDRLSAIDGQCYDTSWDVGVIPSTRLDLLGLFTHELGHVGHVGHPTNGEFATMEAGRGWATHANGGELGVMDRRHLYGYDLKCAIEEGGERELTARYRTHSSSGFSTATTMSGSWNMADISIGMSQYGGTLYFSWAGKRDDSMIFSRYLGTSYTETIPAGSDADWHGIGTVSDVFREDPGDTHAWYSLYVDHPVSWDEESEHPVVSQVSDDLFDTATLGNLFHCSSMSATWFQCGFYGYDYEVLVSGEPLSVAWYDEALSSKHRNGATVMAWVHQERTEPGSDGEIWMTVGKIGDWLLPSPHETGIFTDSSPGVACKSGEAGAYDCILAYSDKEDRRGTVFVERFRAAQGNAKYLIYQEGIAYSLPGAPGTGNKVAAWWNRDRFWVAVRENSPGQPISVYYSFSGNSWAKYLSDAGESFVGPVVSSTWSGTTNRLGLLGQ